mmetsp:Transcript_41540/g.111352  ORF Transcript_41540/g.111352 Transcript_41540/m.111352 type:complete len:296 (-) Transcript_41540:291-1178(-)
MDRGTPTWSQLMVGSPVMTVRAEKSQRLPIRLPRTRPSLPLMRWRSDLMALPLRCVDCGCPAISLFIMVATWYCSSCSCSRIKVCVRPFCFWFRSVALHFRTSPSLNVMSSSPRAPSSDIMAGRTCGGDTARTEITIQSGRANLGSNPNFITSSSEIRFKISSAWSANNSCSPIMSGSILSGASSCCFAVGIGYLTLKLRPDLKTVGWGAPQPRSSLSSSLDNAVWVHLRFPRQIATMSASRRCGCLWRNASRNLISFSSDIIIPHLWQTHDKIFCSNGKKPTWKTGDTNSMCPK